MKLIEFTQLKKKMFPIYKAIKSSKKKKCFIYKKKDGSEKELDLKFHRSFLLFRYFNNHAPESTFTFDPIEFSNEQMRIIYKCVLYSYIAYKDRSLIDFPPEVKLEFEKLDSDVNRIPFYIVTDSTINAIVLSCRGSKCLDDFITDSLGNGVSYDGGKFHQGVFSTASNVFITCQPKLLELNEHLNNNNLNQEDGDESSAINLPALDYISSSEFEDYSEEDENESETIESTQKSSENLNSKHKPLFKHKSSSSEKLHSPEDDHPNYNSKHYKKMMKKHTKIIITGHSLGAAVAAVVSYLFREKFPELDVQCICFAPPPTLSHNLWETTDSYIKSFMIEGDPVPFLSVQNLISISDFFLKHEHANKVFKKFIHNYLNKKSIEEYEASNAMKEPLYPPGQLYLIKFSNGEEDKSLIERQKMHLKKKKDEMKKKFDDLKEKIKKKREKRKAKDDNDDDDQDDEEDENEAKIEVKDDQIQLCHVDNPEYFTNFINNVSEKNHFIKNYTRLMVRVLNKSLKRDSHPE